MHHQINAQPWYRQAAQTVLDAADVPAIYGVNHHGQTSAAVMYSGTEGRLVIMIGTTIGARVIDIQPAPRLADDLARWNAARDEVAALYADAGFPAPRLTRMGLVLEVPETFGAPARVRLDSTGLGRYSVRVDGHPDLTATIDGRLEVATLRGYTLDDGTNGYAVFDTAHAAAYAFAASCGFGPQSQINVTT